MRLRALKAFAGTGATCYEGEVFESEDLAFVEDLVKAGYAEKVEPAKKPTTKRRVKKVEDK